MKVYLDNSATTMVLKDSADAAYRMMNCDYANPSSLHIFGCEAENEYKDAKLHVARLASAKSEDLIFTSGGTESDNLAILGTYESRKKYGNEVITTKVEHPAVLEACRYIESLGGKVTYIGVDRYGNLNMDELKNAISDKTVLISVMTVNNEVGTVMPLDKVYSLKSSMNERGIVHTDAVQAFAKLRGYEHNADLISVSGHKIHAPKGIGALVLRNDARIRPISFGGGQERGMRAGTENMPGIVSFGVAAQQAIKDMDKRIAKVSSLKERFLKGIRDSISDIRINSFDSGFPYILNVSFLGTKGEVILHKLEKSGIMVSTGSACSSTKNSRSHVLKAMGLKDSEIDSAIRFSFSHLNTEEEMDYVVDKLKTSVEDFRKLMKYR